MSEMTKTLLSGSVATSSITYHRKTLSFSKINEEEFSPTSPTIYAIEWNGVTYELLIRRQLQSRQTVVWGNGDFDKQKHTMPVFQRHSWGESLSYNGIWYFDPTAYLGEASLCWCYGTNERWYLKDIAYLIYIILNKWNISLQNTLFFGSSAGGFTSMALAVLLRGKALALNPQFDCTKFWPRLVGLLKKQVLIGNENLIEERVNIVELIKKEKYCPSIHIIQNLFAENDMKNQIPLFLHQLSSCVEDTPIQINFYKNTNGHSGLPSKNECIKMIKYDISENIKEEIQDIPEWINKEYHIDSNKLYIVITCDTEDKYGSIPYLYECDFGEKGNCGVQYIMEQLEKRNMRGVFFTNVYEHKNFTGKYEHYLENLVKNMTERGHEVGLHPHHGLKLYERDFFYDIIKYGIDFIKKNTGKFPISIRGGAYRCSDFMFKYIYNFGIKVDSSCYYTYNGTSNRISCYRSLNQVCMIDNVIEFPIICVFDDNGRNKKFDINQLNIQEIKSILEEMKKRKYFSAAQFMFHSFSFIDQKGHDGESPFFTCGAHKGYGIHQGLMKRFEQFLDCLQQDPDIEVVTFEQYLAKNLPLPSMWGDGVFHTGTEASRSAAANFKGCRNNPRVAHASQKEETVSLSLHCSLPLPSMYFQDASILQLADDLMHDKLVVYSRIEAMPYKLENFDWNVEFSNISRTFQLYLQALNPVQILVRAYEKTKNVHFLEFAWSMISCWYDYANSIQAKDNPFAWGDHATALRSENILYFAVQCEYGGFWADSFYHNLYNILLQHGEWLYDDSHYTRNHNHGIMQDQALLHLGYVLNRQEWIEHALTRLDKQMAFAFNEEKVPTENSPGYAFLVPSLLKKIGEFLKANNNEKGEVFIDCYEQSKRFRSWVMKPNGIVAQKGDTSNIPGKRYGNTSNMRRQDESTSVWWPQAGYYFYRSNQDAEVSHDTWKMFVSGYCNTTHKHADDCSFMLYSKGYEIFADCGIYGYKKDKFREYFISSLAHNSIIVDNKSYLCTKDNFTKIGMIGGILSDKYDHIRAFNDAYEGIHIERDFCSCDDVTIIYDTFNSSQNHIYSQIFHLAEDIKIVSAEFNEVLLQIADSGFMVRLHQYGSPGKLQVLHGELNRPEFGLISRGEGHIDVTSVLKFDVSAENGAFITLITIENEAGIVRLPHGSVHRKDIFWLEDRKGFQLKEDLVILCRDKLPTLPLAKNRERTVPSVSVELKDLPALTGGLQQSSPYL